MKDLSLLVWLTQLGMTTALPLGGFILLAVWLQDHCGWGSWVLWAGIIVGVISALNGFVTSLKALSRITKGKKDSEPPAVSFNDHD
jgi:hypothetical protein